MAFKLFLILIVFLTSGCASMCGQGSSMRAICDDRARGNADLQAQVEMQRQNQVRKEEQHQENLRQMEEQRQVVAQNTAIEQKRAEDEYKLSFCRQPDLFSVAFMSTSSLESNCIYGLGSAPLKVLQVNVGGVLVVPTNIQLNPFDKVIFVKTNRPYVDGDLVQNIYLKYAGVMTYTNTLGAAKTVHSFKYLGERE